MKGPHICDCLCELCEQLGTGAFGPQPDGSPGVRVIRRRRRTHRRCSPLATRPPAPLQQPSASIHGPAHGLDPVLIQPQSHTITRRSLPPPLEATP